MLPFFYAHLYPHLPLIAAVLLCTCLAGGVAAGAGLAALVRRSTNTHASAQAVIQAVRQQLVAVITIACLALLLIELQTVGYVLEVAILSGLFLRRYLVGQALPAGFHLPLIFGVLTILLPVGYLSAPLQAPAGAFEKVTAVVAVMVILLWPQLLPTRRPLAIPLVASRLGSRGYRLPKLKPLPWSLLFFKKAGTIFIFSSANNGPATPSRHKARITDTLATITDTVARINSIRAAPCNFPARAPLTSSSQPINPSKNWRKTMKGLILWLCGVPLFAIVLLYLFHIL